jgi:hypothetical protein
MTQAEKELNKAELKAFKNYDKSQYVLIPGINSSKVWENPYEK